MTMTRNDKRKHQAVMLGTSRRGYTDERFASPRLVRAARAERGHDLMTRREYAQHRLGRGAMPADHIDSVIERRAGLLRGARVLGGRRVNGWRRGYRPAAHEVERCRASRPGR
jgi:hypothetical protein